MPINFDVMLAKNNDIWRRKDSLNTEEKVGGNGTDWLYGGWYRPNGILSENPSFSPYILRSINKNIITVGSQEDNYTILTVDETKTYHTLHCPDEKFCDGHQIRHVQKPYLDIIAKLDIYFQLRTALEESDDIHLNCEILTETGGRESYVNKLLKKEMEMGCMGVNLTCYPDLDAIIEPHFIHNLGFDHSTYTTNFWFDSIGCDFEQLQGWMADECVEEGGMYEGLGHLMTPDDPSICYIRMVGRSHFVSSDTLFTHVFDAIEASK